MERRAGSWSLGALAATLGAVLSVVAIATSIGLVWTTTLLRTSSDAIVRDTESMAIADELTYDLLAHARAVALLADAPEAELEEERALLERERTPLERRMPELLARARDVAGGPHEIAMLEQLERELDAYLEAAARAAAATGDERGDGARRTRPLVNDALRTLVALRAGNALEVRRAYAESAYVDSLSTISGVAAAIVIVLGTILLALVIHLSVLRPLHALRDAIRAHRAGDPGTAFDVRGPREIVEIGDALGEMSGALAREKAQRVAFLAGVAHDLRNPLSPLKMGVALLAGDPRVSASGEARRTLGLLGRQLDHLERMIGDVLDSARVEAGQLELRREELDLREPARESVELHRVSSDRHEILLELPEGPVLVLADRVRVEQVVNNLLSNAIKYSPAGGPVRVELAVHEREAELSVADRGIGIAPEALRDLFAPFSRRPDARAVAPGAGLGLSVVRRIVEAHGGRVEVESAVGEGSTFRVFLPLA